MVRASLRNYIWPFQIWSKTFNIIGTLTYWPLWMQTWFLNCTNKTLISFHRYPYCPRQLTANLIARDIRFLNSSNNSLSINTHMALDHRPRLWPRREVYSWTPIRIPFPEIPIIHYCHFTKIDPAIESTDSALGRKRIQIMIFLGQVSYKNFHFKKINKHKTYEKNMWTI